MTSIISYNVNGIRSASSKGLWDFVFDRNPDIFMIQESKAQPGDVEEALLKPKGYQSYWHSAEKKGYSGVVTYTKKEPKHIEVGCGIEKYDREGRILRLDYDNFSVMNVYIPSGTTGEERQGFKDVFLVDFYAYVKELKKEYPRLIISGDFNICHKPIDIHNPVSNKNSSGFLPHEREWVTQFLDMGFKDSFRLFNSDPGHYTWWSFRAGSRKQNKGWRIDYHMVTDELSPFCKAHKIYPDAIHSDHAAMELVLDI